MSHEFPYLTIRHSYRSIHAQDWMGD